MRSVSGKILAMGLCLAAFAACKGGTSAAASPRDASPQKKESSMNAKPGNPSPAELSARAQSAVASLGFDIRLSPILPAEWPPASGKVEWWVYRVKALPTGAIAYALSGPIAKVALAIEGGDPVQEPVAVATVQGRFDERGSSPPDLIPAEQALIDAVAARSAPDSVRSGLEAYARWADGFPIMGSDLRKRKAEFFRWLGASKP